MVEIAVAGLSLTVVGMLVTGIIWAVRQEGRINTHDTLLEEREKQDELRFQEIIRRLERIERKQDTK